MPLLQARANGAAIAPGAKPDSLRITFPASDTPGTVEIPVPQNARDWTKAGALTFEFRSTSTIGFGLQIRNRAGQTFTYRVQPYTNVPVKASISSAFLLREYMNNRQFKGHWLSNWANHIDLSDVESVTLRMQPNREVTLDFGPISLAAQAVPDEVFIEKPVIDEFGQWAALDWPGKVRSIEQLRRAWAGEDAELANHADFGYCRYGGWAASKHKGSGFFRVEQVDGRWWLIDPDGHLFFSTGADCVRYRDATRAAGRELLFAKLPPGSGETTDFYRANAVLRYGESDFVQNWKAKQVARLKALGFNTVANWSDAAMYEPAAMPFVTDIRVGRNSAKSWQGYPDAFSEEYARNAEADASRQCTRFRGEPNLIGYFIGNEPRWPQRHLVENILRDPEPSATQKFARSFLKEKGDTPASREALLEALARQNFRVVREAIRKADPNHLVLGIRFAGNAPDPVLRANDVFDVFSINIYRFEPPAAQIERIVKALHKPVLIGEFHFGAPERGYAPSLVMVRDQAERGVAYQYYLERAAANPAIIGAHWFQWVDQPVSGRFDGENYNLGFINQQDLPYPEMAASAKATHKRVYRVHAGDLEPTAQQAGVQ